MQNCKNVIVEEVVETFHARETRSNICTLSSSQDNRELNIIIHGIDEKSREYDGTLIDELFHTVGLGYASTQAIDCLGYKSSEKTRPLRLRLAT